MKNITDLSFEEFETQVQKILWDSVKRQTEEELKQNFSELVSEQAYEQVKQIGGDELLRICYYYKLTDNLEILKHNEIFKFETGKEEK